MSIQVDRNMANELYCVQIQGNLEINYIFLYSREFIMIIK